MIRKVKTQFIPLFAFSFFLFSCTTKSKPGESKLKERAEPAAVKTDSLSGKGSEAKNQQTVSNVKPADSVKEVKLVCVYKGENENSNPYTYVMLSLNGKLQMVKSIIGEGKEILRNDYDRYEIPSNAISACGAWYAGAGDYFYVVIKDGKPEVYYGWQEEQEDTPGFHWEKMKLNN
jgi:hypothetical protein